jgi:hypothetical protein
MGPRTPPTRKLLALALSFAAAGSAGAQVFVVGMKTATDDAVVDFHPTHIALPEAGLTERGRRELLQNLVSEQGFAHRGLPLGAGLTLLANGNLTPRDDAYRKMLYEKGQSAAPGDRIAITAVEFKADRIVLDLNGGPYAKHRFLSHIEIGDNPIAQQGPTATGCRITLVFEGGIPELSGAEVKALLDPVIDFHARTSAEAYADTLPPKVREAVAAHEVLVGMTKRMVLASLGVPHSKTRERAAGGDENSPRYEEWIYGEVPQTVRFVRFRGDRVVRLEIAELGKPVEIHEAPQVAATPQTRTIASGDAQPNEEGRITPAKPPTLKKPGEGNAGPPGMGPVVIPGDSAPRNPVDAPHLVAAQ